MQSKQFNKIFIPILLVIIVIGVILFLKDNPKKVEALQASWSYNYKDLEEISQASDVIALVKVNKLQDNDIEQRTPLSIFDVSVMTPVYNISDNEEFSIVMTGAETKEKIIQIPDDPLLKPGDEILVFVKKNDDGTYRILGGPQGRLVHAKGKLNSLNSEKVNLQGLSKVNLDWNILVTDVDAEVLINQIKTYIAD